MKVIVREKEDRDGYLRQELVIDGKERQYVGPLCECPEDAIIGRDLVSCRDIADFMKEAFEAGKRDEEWLFQMAPFEDD